MPKSAQSPSEPEPFRVPDEDLDDLTSTLAATVAEVRRHGALLDRLSSEPDPAPPVGPTTPAADSGDSREREGASSPFIMTMAGQAYATELAALTDWVSHLFLPVYGREVSTTRPWCGQWYEHPEAVARLHALWLAWQQLTDAQAGFTGPSTWHRDHLDHALIQLRAPDGPFAACTTSLDRPSHRLLPNPAAAPAGAAR